MSLVADEGGLAAPLPSNRAALDVLLEGIERSGLEPGAEAAIAVDVAATQLLVDGRYVLASENRSLRAEELVDELAAWVGDYPIVSIEDALGEDDDARLAVRDRHGSPATSSCSATTSSSPRPSDFERASRTRSQTPCS